MKLFTQILILFGFAITMVEAAVGSDEVQAWTSGQGVFVNPSEVNFSAESDYLVIPGGKQEGAVISKKKLGTAMVGKIENTSEENAIFIVDDFYILEGVVRFFGFGFAVWFDHDHLAISFRIRSSMNSYAGVNSYALCRFFTTANNLHLYNCEIESVKLDQTEFNIPISDINVSVEELMNL